MILPGLNTISINQIITVTFTLFAVIDIIGSIPILIGLKKNVGEIKASKATWASGLIMLGFFFIGEPMLNLLGVDIHSFAIAGSIVIFILGLEMVLGLEFFKPDTEAASSSVVPIAFPIIAGSGTLTTLVSLKSSFGYYNILFAILINLAIIFTVIKLLNPIENLLGKSGLMVIRKFFGVILLAIAVKIITTNLAFTFDV